MSQRPGDVQSLCDELLEFETGWSPQPGGHVVSVGGGGWGDVVVQLGVRERGVWGGGGRGEITREVLTIQGSLCPSYSRHIIVNIWQPLLYMAG